MSTSVILLPAGKVSDPIPVTPLMSLCAVPQVLGGTVLIEQAPSQTGPWLTAAAAQGYAQSVRLSVGGWLRVTSATQAAAIVLSDFGNALGAGQGGGGAFNFDSAVNCQAVLASPNSTSEVPLFSLRVPPGILRPNFRMWARATASFTNNVNAKTLQVRMNGLAGTLAFQSPALASNANYAFEADWAGIADGATLKGLGAGATGGFGLSTTALTTLARDYLNNETEFVISCTKATGTDTFQLDSLLIYLQQ